MARKTINRGVTEVTGNTLLRKSPPARVCGESFTQMPSAGHSSHRGRDGISTLERASKYVRALPPAMSGSRGHDALFHAACVLVNGFDLSDDQAWPILVEYNARCVPPWSERELIHKLSEARKVPHREPRGHLLGRHLAKNTASQPTAPPRVIGRITLRDSLNVAAPLLSKKPEPLALAPVIPKAEPCAIEELREETPSEPAGKTSPADPENIEVSRIVGELRKLNTAGALKEPEDPPFFAGVIGTLGATFLPKGARELPRTADTAPSRWSAKMLTGYSQPRTRKEHTDFLMAAFDSDDVFDFANPEDVTAYENLYRRPCRKGPQECE
jgi:hypothetical protein